MNLPLTYCLLMAFKSFQTRSVNMIDVVFGAIMR